MPSTAIAIADLQLDFPGRSLFSGLDLQLAVKEKATLTGPSGCGKSSLLACLLGFLPWQRGSIRIFGVELNEASCWQLRQQIAYVPQQPLLAPGPVAEALAAPFAFHANRRLRPRLELVPELLQRLLLPQTILAGKTEKLSGGETQRLGLLVALLLQRPLLLLDEPSSALDPEAKAAVCRLLEQEELSILSVSHDHEWGGFSSRVIDLPALTEEA